jgi:hypothetical protein
VITFMAVAFLVLSQGQRSAVSTQTDQSLARLTADSGSERAIAQLMAQIRASGNPYGFGLMVPTNYINPFGFVPGIASPTNVNYDVTSGGAPLSTLKPAQGQLLNIANLWYDPRPPVFIVTNRLTGSTEFRYYLDLNRNGRFEPTGWFNEVNSLGQPLPGLSFFVGDPQWIGVLEFPDRAHSANNQFIGRFTYLVQPTGGTLDINYIHNQAARPGKTRFSAPPTSDFNRDQGVGTWEINLASFLFDLNTNLYAWGAGGYAYNPTTFLNQGDAFSDSFTTLTYRYGLPNLATPPSSVLASVNNLYGPIGSLAFQRSGLDAYSSGFVPSVPTLPWPGADTTNHLLSMQELFDPSKTSTHFVNALTNAGAGISSYDRYTFYRLLSQLGTDSAPDSPNKINLNYNNLIRTNGLGITSPTTFVPWQPIDFFTNAANKMLADAGFAFTTTNIQVYPTNYYQPSVHRLLQVAANIYDATTNRPAQQPPFPPSVFRPLFRRASLGPGLPATNVFIVGYREVTDAILASPKLAPALVELDSSTANVNLIPLQGQPFANDTAEPMVSGVPLVIGAKKGIPNFNEFSMQTYFYVSRLLEFKRIGTDPNTPVSQTNQMFVVAMTNAFGLESWNSYSNAYPRNLQLEVAVNMTAILNTNPLTAGAIVSNRVSRGVFQTIPAGTWRGWNNARDVQFSLISPWGATNNCMFLTNSSYVNGFPWFLTQNHIFQHGTGFYVPRWYLNLNTRVRAILVDTDLGRIVDYVNLNHWEPTVDITAKLTERDPSKPNDYHDPGNQWLTNRVRNSVSINAATYGIINQILIGINGTSDFNSFSFDPVSGRDAESAVDGFRFNLLGWSPIYPKDQGKTFYKSNVFYAPFDPYRPVYVHTSWQANDPLVHYTVGDLVDLTVAETNRVDFYSHSPALDNIGQPNARYEPWGGNPFGFRSTPTMAQTEISAKDPLVTRSDNWDFPTNKFANVGWLGRVHRGTPWQTIFLKSTNVLLRTGGTFAKNLGDWQKWTGNPNLIANLNQGFTKVFTNNQVVIDAYLSTPTNDWRLVDLFSAALNDNASRGKLSVNQSGLAGWSAVLAGVNVQPDLTTNTLVQPAGVYSPLSSPLPPLVQIVNGINATRTNFPGGSFQRLGDILATPQLTVASPYILPNSANINDQVVERIPQQILGLLQGGQQPRFTIYSYGQALKPAPHSIMNSGPFPGLCTNYQITAEVATRTVVRVVPDSVNTNAFRTVIESFNVLPPD